MSVKSEEADKKFREWKEDIEKKCAEHLSRHPEPTKPGKAKVSPDGRTVVEVVERRSGEFVVLRNGLQMFVIFGRDAHKQASAYANRLLNNLPVQPPCVICGGRGWHVTGCSQDPQ